MTNDPAQSRPHLKNLVESNTGMDSYEGKKPITIKPLPKPPATAQSTKQK